MPIDLASVKWDTKINPIDVALVSEGVTGDAAKFIRSIYQQESGSGRNTKTSNRGAEGGMQVIPTTFDLVADKGWNRKDPIHNARAGVRYASKMFDLAGGDPAIAAAGYYGGEGGLRKAQKGIAVSDPVNPKAPNTLQYGQQVAARIPKQQADETLVNDDGALVVNVSGVADQRTPDGIDLSKVVWDAPQKQIAKQDAKKVWHTDARDEPSTLSEALNAEGMSMDVPAGVLSGLGQIGSTLLAPVDMYKDYSAGKGITLESNRARRKDIEQGLQSLGADTTSPVYQGAKFGTEVLATAPIGGVLGRGVTAAAPALTRAGMSPQAVQAVSNALRTSGFRGGEISPVANALTRTAVGAGTGAITGGIINPENAAMGAIIGGAIPGISSTAGAAGRAIIGNISPEVSALYQRAKQLGIDIPADRIANSRPLNALASTLNYVPFSGRAATESRMIKQMDTALSRTFGQDSSNVTMALRKATTDLGNKFDDVLKNNVLKVDDELLTQMANISQTADRELGKDGLRAIVGQIDDVIEKGSSGVIDGQAAYNIKRALDRIGGRNSPESYHARELKKALMGALDRSIGEGEAKAFAETRRQYGNMMALENIAQNGAEGGVSVARLANMRNINNPELQEIADIAAQFIKTRESPHGAAQRAVVGGAAGILGGVKSLGAGMAIGRGTNMLLNSNAAKNVMLRTPSYAERPLIEGAYKVAPVLPNLSNQ